MQTNTILCGDSAKVLATFPDECIDLTVASPPYDNLRQYFLDDIVVWRYNISDEEKREVIEELIKRGIKPISSP